MPGTGLKALDSEFIIGLGNLSSKGGAAKVNLKGGGGAAAKVSLGLRSGAQLYASAVQKLSNVGGVLNLSKATLEDLGKLTDKMIDLAERSTKISTSDTTRGKLNREFKKLSNEFRELVGDQVIDEQDVMTKDGLVQIFTLVGLDPDQSESIADLFDLFQFPKEDDGLASEEIKGKSVKLPNAVQPGDPEVLATLQKVSNSDGISTITNGRITQVNSVYQTSQDVLAQNPNGNESILVQNTNGGTQAIPNAISNDVTILNTSETSGYSVVKSKEDFLGYNPSGYTQLFVLDEQGKVIRQASAFTSEIAFAYADVSADGSVVAFATSADLLGTNADGSNEVFSITAAGDLGDAPNISELTQESSLAAGNTVRSVLLNEAGTLVASKLQGTSNGIVMYATQSALSDLNLLNQANINSIVGFMDGNTVIMDVASIHQMRYHSFRTSEFVNTHGAGTDTAFHAVSESGYLIYQDTANDLIKMVDLNGGFTTTTTTLFELDSSDTISRLTVAYNEDALSKVDVGILGTLAQFGDPDEELYRLRGSKANTAAVLLKKPAEVEKIFDRTLADRSNAFVALSDLEALRDQIDENLGVIDNALEILQKNVDVVRAAGLAMLNISQERISADEADRIASILQKEIRKLAPSDAIRIAGENLEPIAVATFVSLEDS